MSIAGHLRWRTYPVCRTVPRTPVAVMVATVAVVCVGHLLFWRAPAVSRGLDDLAHWSGGLVHPTLAMNALELLVLAGLWFAAFGLRLSEVGLDATRWRAGIYVFVVGWAAIQLVRGLVALVAGGSLAVGDGHWVLGAVTAQLFGNALVEEVVHRGLILPQLYQRLGGTSERRRLIGAVVLSSVIFALTHILMLVHRGYEPYEVVGGLFVLALTGGFFSAIYLRTGNLFVVIAVHALTNVSGDILVSPLDGRALAFVLGVGCLIWWPPVRNIEASSAVLARR